MTSGSKKKEKCGSADRKSSRLSLRGLVYQSSIARKKYRTVIYVTSVLKTEPRDRQRPGYIDVAFRRTLISTQKSQSHRDHRDHPPAQWPTVFRHGLVGQEELVCCLELRLPVALSLSGLAYATSPASGRIRFVLS